MSATPIAAGPIITVKVAFTATMTDTPTTDITAYVREMEITRGRQSELEQPEPGQLVLRLANTDRRFDPFHTTGPYYPYVEPNKPISVVANFSGVDYPLFFGYVDSWPQTWPGKTDAEVVLTATDAFKLWAEDELLSPYEIEVLADAPRAWWRLGEQSGTEMIDSSGNGHDGVYEGGATFNTRTGLVEGDEDNSIAFDGTSMRGRVTSAAARVTALPLAVEFWWSGATTAVSPSQVIRQGSGVSGDGWVVSVVDSGASEINVFGAAKFTDLTSRRVDDINATVTPKHIVYKRTATPAHQIYVNGVEVSTAGPAVVADALADTWVMGSPLGGTNEYLAGTLDDVAVYATDLTAARILAHYQAGAAPWDGDTTGGRITRVLDAIGWPAGLRSLDVGDSTLGPATNMQGQTVLGYLQKIAESENGNLYINGSGALRFRERTAMLTATIHTDSQATFADDGLSRDYTDLVLAPSDDHIRNVVTMQRAGSTPRTVTDQGSKTRYGRRPFSRTGLLNDSDNDILAAAQWVAGHYAYPLQRARSLVIEPQAGHTASLVVLMWLSVLAFDLEYRVTVKRNPPGGGATIEHEAHIEHITHHCVMDGGPRWTTTWELSPADTQDYWILGTSTLGESTRLAY